MSGRWDLFFGKHALTNDIAGIGRTFIATEMGESRVAGYFTLSTGSVAFDTIPDHAAKNYPRYPIPTVHLGRLAVDKVYQGRGLGEVLLVEALRRSVLVAEHVGVHVVDVIALHERAKSFYIKYGFLEMLDNSLHLMLPMATVRQLVAQI